MREILIFWLLTFRISCACFPRAQLCLHALKVWPTTTQVVTMNAVHACAAVRAAGWKDMVTWKQGRCAGWWKGGAAKLLLNARLEVVDGFPRSPFAPRMFNGVLGGHRHERWQLCWQQQRSGPELPAAVQIYCGTAPQEATQWPCYPTLPPVLPHCAPLTVLH
jgi:hypothetical protein